MVYLALQGSVEFHRQEQGAYCELAGAVKWAEWHRLGQQQRAGVLQDMRRWGSD